MDFEKLKEYFVDTMILTTTCIDKRKIFTRTQKIVNRVTKILCENLEKEFGTSDPKIFSLDKNYLEKVEKMPNVKYYGNVRFLGDVMIREIVELWVPFIQYFENQKIFGPGDTNIEEEVKKIFKDNLNEENIWNYFL